MSVSISVIPISESTSIKCTLLHIASQGYVLLDCGLDETLDTSHLQKLTPYLKEIFLVLLSQADLAHCGGVPYLRNMLKRQGCTLPVVVASEATQRLGEIAVCALVEEIAAMKDPVTSAAGAPSMEYTIEEAVAAFQMITPVQFGEVVKMGEAMQVVGHSSGRVLGGTYFVLDVTGGDAGQKVVYCVDYNLASTRYLKGLNLGMLEGVNVGLVVTDVGRVDTNGGATSVSGTGSLEQTISSVLRKEGSVLLPLSTVEVVLELLMLLEQWWQEDANMRQFPIAYVSAVGDMLIDQVRSRLEWMNAKVIDKFNSSNNFTYNPFVFEHINFFPDQATMAEAYPGKTPKVVLASGASLEFGEAREIFFKQFVGDGNNAVIFTEHRSEIPTSSLAAKLVDGRIVQGATFAVPQWTRVPLNDEQLREFYRRKLEDERIEDELRRRRFRERERARMGLLAAEAAEVAGGMPVDLIGTRSAWFDAEAETEDAVSGFFRPRLFNAMTRVNPLAGATEAARAPGGVSEYGSAVGRNDVDTWRAHANAGNLKGVGDVEEEEAAEGVKKQVKQQVKQAAKNEQTEIVKDEKKGIIDASMGFDWRRDLTVRFGEPMWAETRERQAKLLCKIHKIPAPVGSSFSSLLMRKEVLTLVRDATVAFLPSDADHHAQLLDNARFGFTRRNFFDLKQGPVRVTLKGKRKLALLKADHLAMASVGSHAVAVITRPNIAPLWQNLMATVDDEIVTPLGERIDLKVTVGEDDSKVEPASVFLADHKISLAEIKRWLTDAGYDAEFTGPAHDRSLEVMDARLRVRVSPAGLIDVAGDHEVLAGLRSLFYKKLRVV